MLIGKEFQNDTLSSKLPTPAQCSNVGTLLGSFATPVSASHALDPLAAYRQNLNSISSNSAASQLQQSDHSVTISAIARAH